MNATASAPRARARFLKKITPKTITDEVGPQIGDREWVALNLKTAYPLYDLYGVISRTKSGHTDKGDWLAFLGQFKAVTPDGQQFDSGKAHIPVLEDVIYSALSQAQDANEKASVEVALRIGIKPAPKEKPSATGYEYYAERLVDARPENDPISRLMHEAKAGFPALEAPASQVPAGATEAVGKHPPKHSGK